MCMMYSLSLLDIRTIFSFILIIMDIFFSEQEMVQRVLNMATEESDNPDLRDR